MDSHPLFIRHLDNVLPISSGNKRCKVQCARPDQEDRPSHRTHFLAWKPLLFELPMTFSNPPSRPQTASFLRSWYPLSGETRPGYRTSVPLFLPDILCEFSCPLPPDQANRRLLLFEREFPQEP